MVVSGAGAAGVAVTKMLIAGGVSAGATVVCDSRGIIHAAATASTRMKAELAELTNAAGRAGDIEAALRGADVLIGVSGGQIPESAVAAMAPGAIVFALANPTPEVDPEVASAARARWWRPAVATSPTRSTTCSRSPGSSRARSRARATRITEGMKVAAADAIARCGRATRCGRTLIVPSPLDPRVAPAVAEAVAAAARRGRRQPGLTVRGLRPLHGRDGGASPR